MKIFFSTLLLLLFVSAGKAQLVSETPSLAIAVNEVAKQPIADTALPSSKKTGFTKAMTQLPVIDTMLASSHKAEADLPKKKY